MANSEDAVGLLEEVHGASLKLTALVQEKLPLASERDPEWDERFEEAKTRLEGAWSAYSALGLRQRGPLP